MLVEIKCISTRKKGENLNQTVFLVERKLWKTAICAWQKEILIVYIIGVRNQNFMCVCVRTQLSSVDWEENRKIIVSRTYFSLWVSVIPLAEHRIFFVAWKEGGGGVLVALQLFVWLSVYTIFVCVQLTPFTPVSVCAIVRSSGEVSLSCPASVSFPTHPSRSYLEHYKKNHIKISLNLSSSTYKRYSNF